MDKKLARNLFASAASGAAFSAFCCLAAWMLLSRSGALLAAFGAAEFAPVFDGLADADFALPWLPLLIVSGACFFLILRYPGRRGWVIPVCVLIFILLIPAALLLTKVNGIRFFNVLRSLLGSGLLG